LYGNIDRSLEKRGSYFHRSALVALSAGPILCLNLLHLNPDDDQVMHRSISTNVKTNNKNIRTIPYQSVYNTDKFWYLSSESYLDGVKKYDIYSENNSENINNVLNFTNVGNKPISVIVKKASEKNTKGYDITLNEWFGAENVPEYLNGTSFVSDYMIEVYVVSGDFGPELMKESKPVTIDNITTPLYTYTFETSDLDDSDDAYVNPYKRFASDMIYQEYFDIYGFKSSKLNKFLNLPSVNVVATYVGSLLPNFTNKLNQNIWIEDIINKDTLTTGLLCSVDVDMIEDAYIDEESGFVDEKIDIIGHNFHETVQKSEESSINFLSYAISQKRLGELDETNGDNESLTYIRNIDVHVKGSYSSYFISENGVPLNVDADNEIIIDMKYFTDENAIKVGDMLLSCVVEYKDGKFSRLTRVVEIKPLYTKVEGKDEYVKDNNHIRVICSDKVDNSYHLDENGNVDKSKAYVQKYSTIDKICDRYHWTFLKGFKVNDKVVPDGKNERQNLILNMISEDNKKSNLYRALIDRDAVQWRYVVDTFGLGIESECKKVYALLCKGRKSGLAIVNAPSIKDFKRNIDPSFINENGSVSSEYISTGGDLSKAPIKTFSLPKEENGASWAAYFYPYLKISDLAAVKTVPPAAYVSNLYILKYTNSKPWSIVAGPKRGVISGNQVIGVEGVLLQDDREYLEPMGINPIVWENGVGVEIFANKTAKQTPQSALSSIHAREVCVYIQDNIESILKKYNWEANTARNREEIKTLVDVFLSNVKQGDGLYEFKTVMDTTNNTTEVIDKNMGIIDVYVEVVKGLEILAQRLTVLKTGSIESGNFE
jgi:hypothetical protein